jgi:two-component system response regulator NreC
VLSPRELQVLRLLARGHTNREVATLLTLSVKTVETHRSRLLEKLGARTRAELVQIASQLGLR